jgi:hypothetical protein
LVDGRDEREASRLSSWMAVALALLIILLLLLLLFLFWRSHDLCCSVPGAWPRKEEKSPTMTYAICGRFVGDLDLWAICGRFGFLGDSNLLQFCCH